MICVINTLVKINLLKTELQLTYFFFNFYKLEHLDLFKYLTIYHEILKANFKGK